MIPDYSNAIRRLRNAAHDAYYIAADKDAEDYRVAADALEALTTERTITINDAAVEALVQRRYEKVAQGQEYTVPGKDRWLEWLRVNVRDDLDAAYAAQNPEGDTDE